VHELRPRMAATEGRPFEPDDGLFLRGTSACLSCGV
jgi:hypothetical protein